MDVNYYFNNKLNENNYRFSILDKEIKFINLNNNENSNDLLPIE